MNILHEYTLESMRHNRKNSISIIVVILMVTTMMSALCGFLYNMYADNLNLVIERSGTWHGELFDNTNGSSLDTIKSFDSVESVMIKGAWMTTRIDDPRREYLVFRDANAQYWDSMPEKYEIMEGRAPSAPGEIALSKQYFEHHPELQIGDILTLPVGKRLGADGDIISPVDRRQPGEHFQEEGMASLKVVGKLDLTTSSVVPAYTALGYLEDSQIKPEDSITVYLRFRNARDTYRELPRIAQAVGYTTDEYGEYELRYNTDYLVRLLVFSPDQMDAIGRLSQMGLPLSYLAIGLFTVGVFVLIIHNAFSLSASTRLNQLGIFASIGATPRQIKRSVLFEAFALSIPPLPFGLVLGQFLVKLMLDFINFVNASMNVEPVAFHMGLMSILPAIALTLLTVWWSALIPARRVAKLSPITAIRQGELGKIKKPRRFSIGKAFGIEGELAGNAVRARARSYRTAVISLTLSFFVLFGILAATSASNANQKIYNVNGYLREESHVYLSLYNAREESDRAVMEELNSLDDVKKAAWSIDLKAAAWLTGDMLSEEFRNAGGYETAGTFVNTQYILSQDGRYRVPVLLSGVDDATFRGFCLENGLDPEQFLDPQVPAGILLNTIEDVAVSTQKNPVTIPYLSKQAGDTLACTEKYSDSVEGDYAFSVTIGGVTDHYPPIGRRGLSNRYGIILFMPMSQVDQLASRFARGGIDTLHGSFVTGSDSAIKPLHSRMETICESWFGSGDYYLSDILEYEENRNNGQTMMNIITAFICGLLAVIGLSNVWSTVLGNLNNRQKEFAVLRSVGIPPRGIRKMLLLEGFVLGVTPLLVSIPFCGAALALLLFINDISLTQWLSFAPAGVLILYVACVLTAVIAAYLLGAKRLLAQNIIEGLKQDTI